MLKKKTHKLIDWILPMVLHGCIHYTKHEVQKSLLEASMTKITFNLCLTKQLLNMFKLWCKSNTRYLLVLTSRLTKITNSFTYLRSLSWMIQVPRTTQSQMTEWAGWHTSQLVNFYVIFSLSRLYHWFLAVFRCLLSVADRFNSN